MNHLAFALILNATSLASIVGAVMLALEGKDGWGWLIFTAIALHTTPSTKKENTDGNTTHPH